MPPDTLPPRDASGKFVGTNPPSLSPPPAPNPPKTDSPPAADKGTTAKPEAGGKAKSKPENLQNLNVLARKFLGMNDESKAEKTGEGEPDADKPKAQARTEPKGEPKQTRKPAPAPKPSAAPSPSPAPAATMTPESIAAAAAKAVAEVMKPAAGKADKPQDAPDAEFSEADRKRIQVYSHMETLGDNYKGVANRYRDWLRRANAYSVEWEKQHPGQEFDANAEEHNEWYDNNPEPASPEEFDEARIDLLADSKAKKRTEEAIKPVSKDLEEIRRAENLRQSEPKIIQHQIQGDRSFWQTLAESYPKTIKDAAGADVPNPDYELLANLVSENGAVNQESLKKMHEADPVAFEIRIQAANSLRHESREIYKLWNGLETPDDRNPVHNAIDAFGREIESELLALPKEQQRDAKGRPFIPLAQYLKLPKEQQDAAWSFTNPADLISIRAQRLAGRVAKAIEEEEKKFIAMAKARGIAVPARTGTPEKPAGSLGSENDEPSDEKPHSPSSPSPTKMAASGAGEGARVVSAVNTWAAKFLGAR